LFSFSLSLHGYSRILSRRAPRAGGAASHEPQPGSALPEFDKRPGSGTASRRAHPAVANRLSALAVVALRGVPSRSAAAGTAHEHALPSGTGSLRVGVRFRQPEQEARGGTYGFALSAMRCRLCVVGYALSASLVRSPSHSRSLARYPAEGTVDGPGVCQVGAGSGVVWSGGVE